MDDADRRGTRGLPACVFVDRTVPVRWLRWLLAELRHAGVEFVVFPVRHPDWPDESAYLVLGTAKEKVRANPWRVDTNIVNATTQFRLNGKPVTSTLVEALRAAKQEWMNEHGDRALAGTIQVDGDVPFESLAKVLAAYRGAKIEFVYLDGIERAPEDVLHAKRLPR